MELGTVYCTYMPFVIQSSSAIDSKIRYMSQIEPWSVDKPTKFQIPTKMAQASAFRLRSVAVSCSIAIFDLSMSTNLISLC